MQEQTCAQCGGTVVTADVLTGGSPVLLAKQRGALSLGVVRGSTLSARVCTSCGRGGLYASTPDCMR